MGKQGRFSLKSSSFSVIIWPPLSSDFRLTTRALHWDRGRPARSVTILSFKIESSSARSGRDARGPSEEVEWSIHKQDLKTENEPVPKAGYSLKSSSFRVIIWPPFGSDFRSTTRALHWDRGRPARSVTILTFEIESSSRSKRAGRPRSQ